MKRAVYFGLFFLFAFAINGYCQKDKNRVKVKSDSLAVDSIKYELIILDPGFDSWLATKPPMSFYSKEYYETKNKLYVMEWNYRNQFPMRFGDVYETRIDYYPNIDYGLELNYRLFYYFRYFEETNHMKLLNTSR
jgi:hypothetical protein